MLAIGNHRGTRTSSQSHNNLFDARTLKAVQDYHIGVKVRTKTSGLTSAHHPNRLCSCHEVRELRGNLRDIRGGRSAEQLVEAIGLRLIRVQQLHELLGELLAYARADSLDVLGVQGAEVLHRLAQQGAILIAQDACRMNQLLENGGPPCQAQLGWSLVGFNMPARQVLQQVAQA